jgi:O-antigen ligase
MAGEARAHGRWTFRSRLLIGTASPYAATLPLAAFTCALTPAYTLRWRVWFYPTNLLEVMLGVTVVVFIIETVERHIPFTWRSPYSYPAALFVVAGIIGVGVSPVPVKGAGLFRAYIVEPIIFFFVVSSVVRSARDAYLVLAGLGIGGLWAGLANTVIILIAAYHHRLHLGGGLPVIIYNNPNAIALYLVPLIGVAASVVLYETDRLIRTCALVFSALACVATLMSFSRGGYLAMAAVAVALVISNARRWILLPAVTAAGYLVSQLPPVARRLAFELNLSNPDNTLVSRIKVWQATLRMLRAHPIFGAGMSGFPETIGPYRDGQFLEQLQYPHNIVLNMWSEVGLLGLAAFTWIVVQVFRSALRGWRRCQDSWRPIQLGVLLAMVAVIAHGLVDVPYWKNDLSLMFWTLLAMTWAGLRWGLRVEDSSMPVSRMEEVT